MAACHILLHFIPLSGAVTLLYLNWRQYFIGPDFNLSNTLQFVAKLHEILMKTSIVEVVACIVRYQALEDFVPLGALSASTQALNISYIWSLDLLAAMTS